MSITAKYRSWNYFLSVFAYFKDGEYWYDYDGKHFLRGFHAFDWDNAEQYTGLKDKNGAGLKEVYECDIISKDGILIGSIHEVDKRETDLLIPRLGSQKWCDAYKEAMVRGFGFAK